MLGLGYTKTSLKPKPMVEIYNNSILWHIMKIYSNFGTNNFINCCGYKRNGYMPSDKSAKVP